MVGGMVMSTYAEQLTPEWLQDAIHDFRHVAELAGFNLGATLFRSSIFPRHTGHHRGCRQGKWPFMRSSTKGSV
jgi:hypothetical protein